MGIADFGTKLIVRQHTPSPQLRTMDVEWNELCRPVRLVVHWSVEPLTYCAAAQRSDARTCLGAGRQGGFICEPC